jgi:formylglycine-generating enzyme required for sulfatase activity
VVQSLETTWRDPGFPGTSQTDEHPVILISWNDAEAFCQWLSEREGVTYRLPTEAEWEYACRGRTQSRFWTGDASSSLSGAANVADKSLQELHAWSPGENAFDDGFPYTAPVASFDANPFGLHDMHGNAWEWCADWYMENAYFDDVLTDPQGPEAGSFRVIRGGGWLNDPSENRSAQRPYFQPTFRYCLLSGFRVLRELQ